jgi:protein FrlC
MKPAFGNYTFALYSLSFFFDAMSRFGIQDIELWGAAPHFYIEDETPESAQALGREIASRGLRLACFTPEQCAYPINIASENPALRVRSVAYFEKAIEYAVLMKAPAVLLTPGQCSRNYPASEAWKRSIEAVNGLAQKAQRLGIELFLEHLTRSTTNLVIRMRDMANYLAQVDSPVVRGMADLDMMGREHEGIADYIAAVGNLPAHVHLVDGFPGGHLVPGDGVLPLVEELRLLRQEGYEGFLVPEVMYEKYLHFPEDAVHRCIDWFTTHGCVLNSKV